MSTPVPDPMRQLVDQVADVAVERIQQMLRVQIGGREVLVHVGQVPDDDILRGVTAAAKYLQCGKQTVYGLMDRGEIPHRRIGSEVRFSKMLLTLWAGGVDLGQAVAA